MFGNIVLIVLGVVPIALYLISKIFLSGPIQRTEAPTEKRQFDSKILVDLSQCEVSSSTGSIQTENTYQGRVGILPLLDSRNYEPYSNYSNREVYCTYVKIKIDSTVYQAPPINKDPISVQVALMQKKTTYIYYNQSDPSDYFFDLDFVYEQ